MKTSILILGLTLVMVFFSERFFWGNFRPGEDTWENYLFLYLFYACLAYAFLFFLHGLKRVNLAQLFVIGFMFALVAEVLVAGLLFSLPASYIFSQPYHVIFTILIGLFWLPRTLINWSVSKIVWLMVGSGLAYGLWSFAWSASTTGVAVSYFNYVPHLTLSTLSLILGYYLLGKAGGSLVSLSFSQWGVIAVGFILVGLSFLHYQLLAIPILLSLGAVLYWLWKLSHYGLIQGSELELGKIIIPAGRLSLLLVFPIVASISAWYCYTYLPDPTEIQWLMLVPVVVYFGFKLYRVLVRRQW